MEAQRKRPSGMKLFSLNQVYVVLLVALFGCLIGLIPGIRMYRY